MRDSLVARVRGLFKSPKQELPRTIAEAGDFKSLLPYVLVLLGVGALARFISSGLIGVYHAPQVVFGMRIGGGWFRAPLAALFDSLVYVGIGIGGWWLLARVLNTLAPRFEARPNEADAYKVAAWTATPLWLAGGLAILGSVPYLGILAGLGQLAALVYAIVLGMWALPLLMGTPETKAPSHILAALGLTLAAAIAATMLFGLLLRLIFATGAPPPLH